MGLSVCIQICQLFKKNNMFLTISFNRKFIPHKAYYVEYNDMAVTSFIFNLTKWYIQKKGELLVNPVDL